MKKYIGVLSLIVAIIALTMNFMSTKKQAYVDNVRLYDSFIMTKELDADFQKLLSGRNRLMDSLRVGLELMSQQGLNTNQEKQEFEQRRQMFLIQQQKFDGEHQSIQSEYYTKIWNRLNDYVQVYCEEQGYDVVFGASGQGNLMYIKQGYNITDELIKYSNSQYKGE